jgi:hypothetical protein
MKGDPAGRYECATCDSEYIVSDAEAFADGFMPAATLLGTGHPMFWKGDAGE